VENLVYLTISTGIGGGLVLGGRLHAGAAGNGGELGHLTVRAGGRLCSCGRRGCLEAYASGTNIAARARERLTSGQRSGLEGVPAFTAADVARLALLGDQLAGSIWRETVELLGQAVTDLVNVFEPDVVVLGGGVTRVGSTLLDPIRRIVASSAMGPAGQAVRIELAGLGDLVGVVGAGAIAFDLLQDLANERALPEPAQSHPDSSHSPLKADNLEALRA
jgi:glucokinase